MPSVRSSPGTGERATRERGRVRAEGPQMTWHVPPALAASATNERPGRGRARGIAHRAIERTERMRRVLPHAPKFRSQDAAPAACRRDVDEGRWPLGAGGSPMRGSKSACSALVFMQHSNSALSRKNSARTCESIGVRAYRCVSVGRTVHVQPILLNLTDVKSPPFPKL